MVAFFIVTAILIGLYGALHYAWNKKRENQENQQNLQLEGTSPSHAIITP